MRNVRKKLDKVMGATALLAAIAGAAFAQCTWSVSSSTPPPSATALTAFQDAVQSPVRIAADSLGRTYLTDSQAGRALVRDEHGRLIFVKHGLSRPLAIAVNTIGWIYLGDETTGSVTVFDASWNPLGKLGQGNGEFAMPNHIAIDPTTGAVYVTDSVANQVKVYPSGLGFGNAFGGPGSSAGLFNFPTGIFISSAGEVLVADQNNDRVQVFDRGGQNFLRCFGKTGGMSLTPKFGRIQGLTGDLQGRIYVADTFQGRIVVFDSQGARISTIGAFGDGAGDLQGPAGLVIDRFNRLLVSSIGNARVEVFGLDSFDAGSLSYLKASVGFLESEIAPTTLGGQKYVRAFISLPGIDPKQIDWTTVTANGVAPDAKWGARIADYDADGTKELGLRFDRNALLATLWEGEAVVPIIGSLKDGNPFGGYVIVTVVSMAGGAQ
jgi:DNA-binding beta-propeller fold protein YncE